MDPETGKPEVNKPWLTRGSGSNLVYKHFLLYLLFQAVVEFWFIKELRQVQETMQNLSDSN